MKQFSIRKTRGQKSFSLILKDSVEGFDDTFSDREDAGQFADFLNDTVIDYNNGHSFFYGKPTKPGVYLVEIDGKFTVVKVFNDHIEGLTSEPVGEIARYFSLEAENV